MSRPIDADQRQQALDPSYSYIVQAPAGSGKTGLITQRFLVMLTCVASPEEIVAVTFTRKAAAEMRERLLEALRLGTQPLAADADAYQQQMWALAKTAMEHDAEQQWQLLNNPARLRIQTIDSLCASLTRQLPIMSGFGAQPSVSDDSVALYREAAQKTLADLEAGQNWSPAIELLLGHLDNNLNVAESMLIQMLARRDQWLRHLVNIRHEPEWRTILESALQSVINEVLVKAKASIPQESVPSLIEALHFASENVPEEHPLACCHGLKALPDTLPEWLGICELLLTKAGAKSNWRKSLTKATGFPAPTSAKEKSEKERYKIHKVAATELIGTLQQDEGLFDLLDALRYLPAPEYTEWQWHVVEAMCELLLVAVAHLRVVFGSCGQVDFSEISQSALHALGDDEAPSDLALALDYSIQHLLVDEFQDTSHGQYRLLEKLTAGWQRGDGRTLFLVGDPMQSIYRFREAEVGLYLRARREGIGYVPLTPLTLSVNFRSQAGVVDWVNEAFSIAFPGKEDVTTGAVSYSPSQPFHGHDGEAVQVHPSLSHDTAAEGEQVVKLIQQALRDNPKGSVAVLVRARPHLIDIIGAMKRHGLRYRAIDIEQLGHRPVVQDLYVLTRALLHPADRLAWLAVLRAPWCGLSLADLTALTDDSRRSVIWQLLNEEERMLRLSAQGQQRLTRLLAVFEQAFESRGYHTLRHWVEATWLALGGGACVENETDLEDAEVYLALLEQLDVAGGLEELQQLDERLGKLFALPDIGADERIQIMTIHKSKGLEFDTVILPGLGRKAPPSDNPMLMSLERWGDGGSELLLAPVRATGDEHDDIYSYLKRIDRQKGDFETGRVLYVAATRARSRLHLLGHTLESDGEVKLPQSSSLLRLLWPIVEGDYTRVIVTPPQVEQMGLAIDDTYATLKRLEENWMLPVPDKAVDVALAQRGHSDEQFEVEFLWAGETARHVGTVVHELLQRIATDGVQAWPLSRVSELKAYYRTALLQNGVTHESLDEAGERVAQSLLRTLQDEKGLWLLDKNHQESGCEYAVSGVINERVIHAVIDRTFVDTSDVRWIIDYKTSVHEGGDIESFLDNEEQRYRFQLDRYAQLMSQKEDRLIRLGLYFPLMQSWRSWSY
ncbi:UvrD-helicase domain-containing protein [Pseudomonadota bacterium]